MVPSSRKLALKHPEDSCFNVNPAWHAALQSELHAEVPCTCSPTLKHVRNCNIDPSFRACIHVQAALEERRDPLQTVTWRTIVSMAAWCSSPHYIAQMPSAQTA